MLKEKILFFIFLLFIFFISGSTYAQDKGNFKKDYIMGGGEEELLEDAEWYMGYGDFARALPIYIRLYKHYPGVIEYKYYAGICYINKPDEQDKAIPLFEESYSKKPTLQDIYYYLGKSYFLNYRFKEAIGYLKLAGEQKKITDERKKEIKRLLENCDNANMLLAQYEQESRLTLQNIGYPLNSEFDEYVPLVSSDESVMAYTYKGKKSKGGLQNIYGEADPEGEYYEDVFMSYRLGNKWLDPENAGYKINTKGHDAAIALSADGQQLFIYKENYGGDIYVSKLERNLWSEPVRITGEVNTKSWEGSVSLSVDGKTLYFSSDRPGGSGGKDIYTAMLKDNGTWGNVKNMGNKINTPYDDDAPFIHASGNLLYFSSKGHNSMGGYDIFYSVLKDGQWTSPDNLGPPVNTTNDDIYYVVSANGERAYFSSTRKGGFGGQDIYVASPGIFGEKPALAVIKGTLKNNNKIIEANIKIVNITTDESYGIYTSNAATGNYLIALPPGSEYKIEFEIKGKLTHTENVNLKSLYTFVEIEQEIELSAKNNPDINETDGLQKKIELGVESIEKADTSAQVSASEQLQTPEEIIDQKPVVAEEKAAQDQTKVPEPAAPEIIIPIEDKPAEKIADIVAGDSAQKEQPKIQEPVVQEIITDQKSVVAEETAAQDQTKAPEPAAPEITIPIEDKPAEKITAISKSPTDEIVAAKTQEPETKPEKKTEAKSWANKDDGNGKFENILFDFDKSSLRIKSKEELEKAVQYMTANQDITLELAGHADAIGTEKYNLVLSKRRSNEAGKYLVDKGVPKDRIKLLAYGETLPVSANKKDDGSDNPSGRQINRRVEIVQAGSVKRDTNGESFELFETQTASITTKKSGTETSITASAGNKMNYAGSTKKYRQILSKYGTASISGLIYKIQVAAYRKPENFKDSHLDNLGKTEVKKHEDGITRFTIGSFNTLLEAEDFRIKVIDAGQADAFVVAEHNGERLLVKQLIKNSFYLN